MEIYGSTSIIQFLAVGLTPAAEVIGEIDAILEEYGDDPIVWLRTRRYLSMMHAIGGNFDEARRLAAQGTARARELGMEGVLASGYLRDAADIAMLTGELVEAERHLREATEILQRLGDRGHLDSVAPNLAWVLLATPGREQEATDALALAHPIADDADAEVRFRATTAVLLAQQGSLSEAEELARDAVERAWRTEYVDLRTLSQEALAKVLVLAGRSAEAATALERAIAVYEAKGNIVAADSCRRAVAELEAAADVPD